MGGVLREICQNAADLGPPGHIIIILYLLVAMPFGWGYGLLIVAGGFSFGWAGLISGEIGTVLGTSLCYWGTRKFFSDWVKMKMKSLKTETQKVLLSIELAVKTGKGSLGMQIGMRANPVLPFGWTNAILGIWEIPFHHFVLSSTLGCQLDLLMKTNVGVLLKTVDDMTRTTPETEAVLRVQLIINIAVLVVVVGAGFFLLAVDHEERDEQGVGSVPGGAG